VAETGSNLEGYNEEAYIVNKNYWNFNIETI
jgi:hypothetical protein